MAAHRSTPRWPSLAVIYFLAGLRVRGGPQPHLAMAAAGFSYRDFVAGAVGGSAGIVAGHPLDTIRVRLQTLPAASRSSAFGVCRHLMRKEGALSLFRGMASPIASVGFMNAILFFAYGQGKAKAETLLRPTWAKHMGQSRERLFSYSTTFFGGCFGGFACAIVTGPSELVKIQLQVLEKSGVGQGGKEACLASSAASKGGPAGVRQHQPFSGSWSCAKHLWKVHGPTSLFRGMGATLVRDVHSYGTYFLTYAMAKDAIAAKVGVGVDEPAVQMVAGAWAGVVAWTTCYPMDVIKSRVQADLHGDVYPSVWKAVKRSYREEGTRAFTRGYLTSISRAVPVNAITFLVYEWVLRVMHLEGL